MRKWTSVESTWDVLCAYTVCWAGTWLLCAFYILICIPQSLVAFDISDYLATLTLLLEGILFAVAFGFLFSGFHLGIMRVVARFWCRSRLRAYLCSNAISFSLGVSIFLLIKAFWNEQSAIDALPFALANIISGFVIVRPLLRITHD